MSSPFAYIGGKSRLAKQIISLIPEHKTYVEAFSGAAWIFFRKDPSRVEVINDLDSELITFYRVVQNHLEEFLKQFKWLLTSRELFLDWKDQLEVRGLTDIQKAARYYWVQRLCFGGKVKSRSYGVQIDRAVPRINLLRLEEEMSAVHLRLAYVRIENLPALELIKRYDRPDTFFYCDPPYHGHPDYKHNMTRWDYEKIAKRLSEIEGRFILSINDNPNMREVFKDFKIQPVSLLYSVGKKPTKAKELIITN
ncbi:MAG: DNA adenine methylase [Deltaproteobacteria bacterium]|nr:DNA adenine methylase [Deltaproteobacteria bacterium]